MVGCLLGEPAHPVEYDGIGAMATTFASCYDEGAFYVDERGYLEVDEDGRAAIARRHHPTVELWR